MSDSANTAVSRREKTGALLDVARFNPKFMVLIIGLGLVAAVLEGVGLGFILPIVEIVQAEKPGCRSGWAHGCLRNGVSNTKDSVHAWIRSHRRYSRS